MEFTIKHEIRGRLRVHCHKHQMSCDEADILEYYLTHLPGVSKAKVYENTADAVVTFAGDRQAILDALAGFHAEDVDLPSNVLDSSGRALNAEYKEKLIQKLLMRLGRKLFLPLPVQTAITAVCSVKYIAAGLKSLAHRKLEVSVLDATAITVSMLRGNFSTASSVMFLLGIGELLEEWTHKKSVSDLAQSMSLNVSKVWLNRDGQEVLVAADSIVPGDEIVVHTGNVIPFDGTVADGEAMVNQSSMTGESLGVYKQKGSSVYAGTVVEEGSITFSVRETRGATRYEKIVSMIEETEKLKSSSESKAEHLADKLVPYTLAGTALTWLLTRNATKALAVLMVDFSCALKLAMPVTVLSAIREARSYDIMVKGGKYLEAFAAADTIVFDKTGTLTEARPTVKMVVPFGGRDADEMLRVAACLEEHFPHSMAKAVVDAAKEKKLEHEEMHSTVNYIVAHGIASEIEGQNVIIGSHHFVFEDEHCTVPEDEQETFDNLPEQYSHLFLAIDRVLAAVICIEDPLRPEAPAIIAGLRDAGVDKLVMMTGDSRRTAAAIAAQVGIDEYYAEVLPEDKAKFVDSERKAGRTVIMVGDGINDSPALSAANVGIAVSDGAELAREIADITINQGHLDTLVTLKHLSNALIRRIDRNYRQIATINTGLILLGVFGILMPTTSAFLHNMSTLVITLKSMKNLL
ncbi:MAG: heavy metal translocating P-type ATPase [Eubacterium sp.]|nr:heavy metal translocating P-type ATPase [Eubacterium sp.]